MACTVFVKSYPPPKINKKEILRCTGSKKDTSEISALIDECEKEAENHLSYKVSYAEFPISVSDEDVNLGFAKVKSRDLAKNLKGCARCLVFCATVGIGIDRLISKYSILSPSKALVFQALGAERIESLCNLFNKETASKYKTVKPRFSPGYGDLSIELQREIISTLACYKNIGVTLNESLLMSPSKSVTAIIGISDTDDDA